MKKLFFTAILLATLFTPALLLALAPTSVTNVFDAENLVLYFLRWFGILFWSLSVMLFLWGVVKFMKNAEDSKAREEGKKFIFYGIIVFVVILSLWAIVGIFTQLAPNPANIGYVDKTGTKL